MNIKLLQVGINVTQIITLIKIKSHINLLVNRNTIKIFKFIICGKGYFYVGVSLVSFFKGHKCMCPSINEDNVFYIKILAV